MYNEEVLRIIFLCGYSIIGFILYIIVANQYAEENNGEWGILVFAMVPFVLAWPVFILVVIYDCITLFLKNIKRT